MFRKDTLLKGDDVSMAARLSRLFSRVSAGVAAGPDWDKAEECMKAMESAVPAVLRSRVLNIWSDFTNFACR
jgi:hypothetical protein